MATYVISDIHGEYEMFMELLGEIGLRADDTLSWGMSWTGGPIPSGRC